MRIEEFIAAAKNDSRQVIEEYLNKGLDINARNEYGFTALLEAAEFGHAGLFWFLIQKGADPTAKTPDGFSLIHAAAIGGSVPIFDFAIKNGCHLTDEVEHGEQKGFTALDYARMCNQSAVISRITNK